jgi:Holliday junction resolvase RusA-like endonuclease
MSGIELHILGAPVPQPRVKGRLAGRPGAQFIQIYTPSTADEWKASIRAAAHRVMGNRQCVGPLRLCTQFLMPRPESHFLTAGLRPDAPTFHTNERADIDNLVKAVMDACTDAGLWSGDGLVCQLYAEKRYVPALAVPGARVSVSRCVEEYAPELFAQDATTP